MPQRNADVLEVLIAKMGEYGNINLILGKTLSVLPETELFQPVRNLLHRGPFSRIYRGPTAPLDQVDSEFMRQIRSVVVTAGLNMPSRCPRRDPPHGRDYCCDAPFTSEMGQTAKNSQRAYVFRFAPELGHCATRSALRICARSRLMHRSKGERSA